ncbi:MAG: SDR family oxidoreductase [Pseudomonadota bacterium]
MGQFDDKSVIVTGAASGFGKAMCEKFAAAGAAVVAADLNLEGAKTVADSLPKAIAVEIDVADEDQTIHLVQATVEAFGKIDVFCANAGIPHRAGPAIEMETAEFDRMFAINTRSVFLAAKHAVPHMRDGSSIVATSSIGAKRTRPGLAAYYAAKGAVLTLTKALAVELAPKTRVNAVCPVSAPTGFDLNAVGVAELPEAANAAVIAGIPMGRRAEPRDVADATFFLASDEARFLTGVCLDVDGGRAIQ